MGNYSAFMDEKTLKERTIETLKKHGIALFVGAVAGFTLCYEGRKQREKAVIKELRKLGFAGAGLLKTVDGYNIFLLPKKGSK